MTITQERNSTISVAFNGSRRRGSFYPEELVTVISIYEVLLILFCLVGYALVVFAMFLNAKLRSNCNYFILSMGLADCLIATIVIPVSQGQLLKTISFKSVAACEFVSDINLISITAVALNLCAVTLERFCAIVYPFRYEIYLTTRKALGIIAGIWLYALVVGLFPQMGWSASRAVVSKGFCNWPLEKTYLIFTTVLHFCIPAFLIVVTNILIYRIAARQAQRIFKTRACSRRPSNASRKYSTTLEIFRINYRAARSISIIAGAYLICWLPQMSVLLIGLRTGYSSIPPVVFIVTLALQYTSSAVNPCIFCLLHKEIRTTLIREVKARFPLLRRRRDSNARADLACAENHPFRKSVENPTRTESHQSNNTHCIELSSGNQ